MGNLWSQFSNNFRDLTRPAQMETSSASFLNLLSVNDAMAERYSRDRFQFYANLWEALNSPDPTIVDRVLGLEMKNRAQYEQVQESKRNISQAFNYLQRGGAQRGGAQYGGVLPGETDAASKAVGEAVKEKTWYANKLEKVGDDPDMKRALLQEWKDDPIYSPAVEAVSTTDRIVFIAVTYAFRAITLYLIEWSLHNRMITSFERAFWYYFFIYISMFILLVMIVNIQTENPALRMMFYYVNTDIKGGTLRVYTHCLAQLLLIIIPFILRETSASTSQQPMYLTFKDRQNIINTLSQFTLFMWILTSAIALRI